MKGKVAAITGGSGTLGRAFTKGLAEQGVTVFILNRNKAAAQEAVDELRKEGLEIHSVICDVLDEKSVENAGLQDIILEVKYPTEETIEILPNGKRKVTQRKV